nr:LLM class flavin-dependent oxidoreductase [Salinispora arenicola]
MAGRADQPDQPRRRGLASGHRRRPARPATLARRAGRDAAADAASGPRKPARLPGAVGPRNLRLTGEIADGWLGIFLAPEHSAEPLAQLAAGRARAGQPLAGFDVAPTGPVVFGNDLNACALAVRPYAARYLGGMGSREQNFDNQLCADMGYADAAAGVSTLIAGLLSGDIERGIATPPGLAEALDISGLGD